MERTTWRKSSYSGTNGESECVEVALNSRVAGVRDSKNVSGPVLEFTAEAWRLFLGGHHG